MTIKAGIIGAGRIAQHLQLRLEKQNWEVIFSLCQNAYVSGQKTHERKEESLSELLRSLPMKPDIMFLAIPTVNRGEAARDYIQDCVNMGIPIVTCEKGALAYHAKILEPSLNLIGFTAAVGGGTQLLRYVRDRRLNKRKVKIHAVLNGTLNFVFDEIARGSQTLGEACQEAMRLGYAEPGASDPLSLVNGELQDVIMKTCVFFNTALAQAGFLDPTKFAKSLCSVADLEDLSRGTGHYRFIVYLTNHSTPRRTGSFLTRNFEAEISDWYLLGGFHPVRSDDDIHLWLPSGVGNAVHITEGELGSGGAYTLSGPGAGHEPTTTAMLNDAERLLKIA